MGLKKQFLKSYLDFKIVADNKGLLTLYSKKIGILKDKNDIYIHKVFRLLTQIKGVKEINLNKSECTLEIIYQPNILNAEKLIKYIDLILDVVVENVNLIKNCPTNRMEDLFIILEAKLRDKISKIHF